MGQGNSVESDNWLLDAFTTVYNQLEIPFTLEYVVVGVTFVMFLRFLTGYLATWGTCKDPCILYRPCA